MTPGAEIDHAEAWLCGLVLSQLGADVVTIEPPGGHDCSGFMPHRRDAYLRGRME